MSYKRHIGTYTNAMLKLNKYSKGTCDNAMYSFIPNYSKILKFTFLQTAQRRFLGFFGGGGASSVISTVLPAAGNGVTHSSRRRFLFLSTAFLIFLNIKLSFFGFEIRWCKENNKKT